jgi:hypothetical protein
VVPRRLGGRGGSATGCRRVELVVLLSAPERESAAG